MQTYKLCRTIAVSGALWCNASAIAQTNPLAAVNDPDASSVATQSAPSAPAPERFNGTSDQNVSDIVVTGGRVSANGVTNTTPGGGLMADQAPNCAAR